MTKFKDYAQRQKVLTIAGAAIVFCEIFFLGMIGGSLIDFDFEGIIDEYIVDPLLKFMYELEAQDVDISAISYTDYDMSLMELYSPYELKQAIKNGTVSIDSLSPDFLVFFNTFDDDGTKEIKPHVVSNPKTGGIYVIP